MPRRVRAAGRLLRDLWAFAWTRRAFWIVPVVLVLLLLSVLIVAGATLSPLMYTVF